MDNATSHCAIFIPADFESSSPSAGLLGSLRKMTQLYNASHCPCSKGKTGNTSVQGAVCSTGS